jgi:hypothetical protein
VCTYACRSGDDVGGRARIDIVLAHRLVPIDRVASLVRVLVRADVEVDAVRVQQVWSPRDHQHRLWHKYIQSVCVRTFE